jgi:hypothetical protein
MCGGPAAISPGATGMIDRARLAAFVEHPRFQNFILAVIVFNAIILGLETSATAMEVAGELLIFARPPRARDLRGRDRAEAATPTG